MKTETQILEKIREIELTSRVYIIENQKPYISSSKKMNYIILKILFFLFFDTILRKIQKKKVFWKISS